LEVTVTVASQESREHCHSFMSVDWEPLRRRSIGPGGFGPDRKKIWQVPWLASDLFSNSEKTIKASTPECTTFRVRLFSL